MIPDGQHKGNYGDKHWYKNGTLHREDGPAIEYREGARYWYLNGKFINVNSQEEFEQYLRLLAFL
jgi:hypothetical protein